MVIIRTQVEQLASNSPGQPSAGQSMPSLDSPGHSDNLVDPVSTQVSLHAHVALSLEIASSTTNCTPGLQRRHQSNSFCLHLCFKDPLHPLLQFHWRLMQYHHVVHQHLLMMCLLWLINLTRGYLQRCSGNLPLHHPLLTS